MYQTKDRYRVPNINSVKDEKSWMNKVITSDFKEDLFVFKDRFYSKFCTTGIENIRSNEELETIKENINENNLFFFMRIIGTNINLFRKSNITATSLYYTVSRREKGPLSVKINEDALWHH